MREPARFRLRRPQGQLLRGAGRADVHRGSYHRAARRAADAITTSGDRVMIVSAFYGLLLWNQDCQVNMAVFGDHLAETAEPGGICRQVYSTWQRPFAYLNRGHRLVRISRVGGPMAEENPICQQLADQIADLTSDVAALQEILDTEHDLSAGTVQRIQRTIWEKQATINRLNRELILCRSDLTIVGVEITQGIQFFSINGQGSGNAPDNSVPLVAQRTTVLRVYLDCKRVSQQDPFPGPPPFPIHISGRVMVDRLQPSGFFRRVATLQPINGPIAARSSASIDRGNANHTLNFRVPGNDCQGHLRFTVQVFEQGPVLTELTAAAGPASFSTQVFGRFEPVPTFRVHGVLVHYTGDGMDLVAPSGLDLAATLEYVMRTYPIGRIEFDDCTEIEFDKNLRTPGGGCGPGFEGPGGLMEILAGYDKPSDPTAIHVALIPRAAVMSVGGCGNRNIAAAKVGAGATLAQEMGHALDRKHAPEAPGYDPDFPHYGTYPWGSIGEYGFDVVTSEVYDPTYVADFMSYDWDRWVSPFTYMGIRDTMFNRFRDRTAARSFQLTDDVRQETLFLSFRVQRDGTVQVRPGFHLPARPQPIDRSPLADVSCELLDADGEVLMFHRCRLRGSHLDPNGPHIDFREALLWRDEAIAIRFLRDKQVLHVHSVEESAPVVELSADEISYSEKPVTLSWAGRHSDRELTYLVRYSNDAGQTWRVVAANLSQSECRLRQRTLPGGERCLVQVVASSGIRTSVAQSKPFVVPVTPRKATILSAETSTGQVVLRGGAFSPDFGLGAPQDVAWSSNLDGLLGHGFALVADRLTTQGLHVITLTAPDGLGGVATASTSVTVALPTG
jgi:hypothetical protein